MPQPYHNIAVTNGSFPPSTHPTLRPEILTTSAYLLPSFTYIPFLPRVSFDAAHALVKGHLLPKNLHPAHDAAQMSPIHRDRLRRSEPMGRFLPGVRKVEDVLVLVCGHGGRDLRCGVMGPLLKGEFEAVLAREEDVTVLHGPVEITDPSASPAEISLSRNEAGTKIDKRETQAKTARVGLVSHIGGHKFAGNVIIYIPPGFRGQDGKMSALAGTGIWYGRVEPKHVEGIVKETVLGGRVIEELFRGGVKAGGEILRL
jgi:(2Fe-2S) ferredoxin